MKKYIAEGLGTATLALIVGLCLKVGFSLATPILAALVLGLFVYSIGHISGAHINPAVTIGVWSIGKISSKEALFYIIAQFIGAGVALLALSSTVGVPNLNVVSSTAVIFAEFLGTFFFTFGVASVVYDKTPKDISGVVIGGSLLLGISFAVMLGSNGVINPAVALGIGSFGLAYIIAPVIGSALGMNLYKYLAH